MFNLQVHTLNYYSLLHIRAYLLCRHDDIYSKAVDIFLDICFRWSCHSLQLFEFESDQNSSEIKTERKEITIPDQDHRITQAQWMKMKNEWPIDQNINMLQSIISDIVEPNFLHYSVLDGNSCASLAITGKIMTKHWISGNDDNLWLRGDYQLLKTKQAGPIHPERKEETWIQEGKAGGKLLTVEITPNKIFPKRKHSLKRMRSWVKWPW